MSLHVGEVGVAIECDMGIDVSGATTLTIILRRSDDSVIQRAATLVQGSTTKIECATQAGDITKHGRWIVQPKAVWASGDVAYGEERDLMVKRVLA